MFTKRFIWILNIFHKIFFTPTFDPCKRTRTLVSSLMKTKVIILKLILTKQQITVSNWVQNLALIWSFTAKKDWLHYIWSRCLKLSMDISSFGILIHLLRLYIYTYQWRPYVYYYMLVPCPQPVSDYWSPPLSITIYMILLYASFWTQTSINFV